MKHIKHGLLFCLGQAFIEANLAYGINLIDKSSKVNYEGLLFYFFIRTLLTIVPYILGFYIFSIFFRQMMLSVASFIINIFTLTAFIYFGLIQIDILTIVLASIVTASVLIFIEYSFNLKQQTIEKKNAST